MEQQQRERKKHIETFDIIIIVIMHSVRLFAQCSMLTVYIHPIAGSSVYRRIACQYYSQIKI